MSDFLLVRTRCYFLKTLLVLSINIWPTDIWPLPVWNLFLPGVCQLVAHYLCSHCLPQWGLDHTPENGKILMSQEQTWHRNVLYWLVNCIEIQVHSIINRSPVELVEEIILVDDASEQDHLGSELEDYVKNLPLPVFVLRTGVRSGLIRARWDMYWSHFFNNLLGLQ